MIDERYASTVRLIFSLAKDGKGISQIRNYLNGHEPIVSPKDFELVQRLITSRRNVQNKPRKFENIFAGLIKCADCGYAMTLAKAHRSPKEEIIDEYGYMCNNYKTFGKSVDTSHWIEARQLYECVLNEEGRAKRYINKSSKIKAFRYSVTVQLAGNL